jgi:hypothetical protein
LKQCLGKPDSEPTDRAFVLFRNEFGITPVNYPGHGLNTVCMSIKVFFSKGK